MIASMTGYGRGEVTSRGITATVEVRGVNSRFLEVNAKLPPSLVHHENDVKEIVRSKIIRGKVSLQVSLEAPSANGVPLRVNSASAKAYYKLLNDLRRTLKMKDKISLEHVLKFSEVFEPVDEEKDADAGWEVVERAIVVAMDEFNAMRKNEGEELARDLRQRISGIAEKIEIIEQISKQRIPEERERLRKRIEELIQNTALIDNNRLEMEIAMLADRLDVTEECVRFRSHNKLFLEALSGDEAAGRKLNFLIQEMNREANTIGSKSNDAQITHLVVAIKEELEKIREQLQNIE
jgi:uncharacterized protein (TIGR00255 family)